MQSQEGRGVETSGGFATAWAYSLPVYMGVGQQSCSVVKYQNSLYTSQNLVHYEAKKTALFYFCNMFAKPLYIATIIGSPIPC